MFLREFTSFNEILSKNIKPVLWEGKYFSFFSYSFPLPFLLVAYEFYSNDSECDPGQAYFVGIVFPCKESKKGYVTYYFTPAAEGHGLWPWMNAPAFGRDVAPLGRQVWCHGLCPWGSTIAEKFLICFPGFLERAAAPVLKVCLLPELLNSTSLLILIPVIRAEAPLRKDKSFEKVLRLVTENPMRRMKRKCRISVVQP
jgi:hypothetical protein